MHGPDGRTAVAYVTVPDPVRISLEFPGDSRVGHVARDKFPMGTVMAGRTEDLVVHIARHRVL